MKYFTTCTTLDELKKEYRRLAMANHPDRGGDEATMKAINAEYDAVFPAFKLAYNRTAQTPTAETAQSTRSEFYTANGWKGSNYDSALTLKEIAQLVRQFIKEQFPTYKFSVRTSYASMCQELHVAMKEAPCKIHKDFEELTEEEKNAVIRKATRNHVFSLNSWTDSQLKAEFERIWAAEGDWYKCPSDQLKAAGYRWHSKKQCWYARNTEQHLQALRAIETGLTA